MNAIDVLDNRASWAIIEGDALASLRSLPDGVAHCVVTSVPYYNLRDYGVIGQIGLEKTLPEYLAALVEVFREARRVLTDTGVLWLNCGDSYSGAGGYSPNSPSNLNGNSLQSKGNAGGKRHIKGGSRNKETGLGEKQLMGVPWRLAFALQDDGWILRSDVIWSKDNPMPESVTDRPSKSHEYIFLFSKRERYFFDVDAIREPYNEASLGRYAYAFDPNAPSSLITKNPAVGAGKIAPNPLGRNVRTVWNINTRPADWDFCLSCERFYRGRERTAIRVERWLDEQGIERKRQWCQCGRSNAWVDHYAAFPPDLALRCILAGCPIGGVVLDPFVGSGTSVMVAQRRGRRGIGFDLNASYCRLAQLRVQADAPLFNVPTLVEPRPLAEQLTLLGDVA